MAVCSVCSKVFSFDKNLYNHMRKKHNVAPQMKGKISCPLSCENKYRTQKDLRQHLESFHKQVLENEVHEFHDFESFSVWKKRLEESSGFAYVRRISEKVLSSGEAKTYYICNRSGVFKSKSTGKRSLRSTSYKIGSTCPAVMEVSRFVSDGKVTVVFWRTHFGHDADPKRKPSRRLTRLKKADMIDFDVCVVLPAAGTGQRMGVDIPKQYISIHEKPVICHTVDAFLRLPFIKKIVVVAATESLSLMLNTLTEMCDPGKERLIICEGYKFRHQSILSGLTALQTLGDKLPEVVILHDGVRPFFTEDIICDVVEAAKRHGAAGVTCPLVSTVISADEDAYLDTCLDRNKYRASEMPQAFQYNLLWEAYKKCSDYDFEFGTECLQIVQKYMDIKAKLLPGTSHLWKITHRKDIYAAKSVIKENQAVGIMNSKSAPDFLPVLKLCLSKTFKSVHLVEKLSDSSGNKLPNIVQMHDHRNYYDLIGNGQILPIEDKPTQWTSIVHIFLNSFDETLNILEFQKQAKASAKKLKESKVLVYYVSWEECDSAKSSLDEKAELVTSLLFESNPCLTGSVFFS